MLGVFRPNSCLSIHLSTPPLFVSLASRYFTSFAVLYFVIVCVRVRVCVYAHVYHISMFFLFMCLCMPPYVFIFHVCTHIYIYIHILRASPFAASPPWWTVVLVVGCSGGWELWMASYLHTTAQFMNSLIWWRIWEWLWSRFGSWWNGPSESIWEPI